MSVNFPIIVCSFTSRHRHQERRDLRLKVPSEALGNEEKTDLPKARKKVVTWDRCEAATFESPERRAI